MPRPDKHRGALVAGAGRSLQINGYASTSIAALLEGANAANGSLYHHFPGGKKDLALTALEVAALAVDRSLAEALERTPDPGAAVEAWIDALIRQLERDPLAGCPVAPTAVEGAATDEDLRLAAHAAFERWRTRLEGALEGPRAATTARVVLSAIEGALLLDRTARSTENLKALRASVRSLVEMPSPSHGDDPRSGETAGGPAC